MQDEHPPAGQGRAKLCLRQATACDPASDPDISA